jgi:transcriptional regulator with XRE-family HTH domain
MSTHYAHCGVPRNGELRFRGMVHLQTAENDPRMPKKTSAMSPEAVKMQGNLRAWRVSRKLTQSALAEHIGSKVSTISGWELGERSVNTEDLQRLARFYGVHPAALLFAPEEAGPKVQMMIEASGVAEKLTPEAAKEWIGVGRRMAKD